VKPESSGNFGPHYWVPIIMNAVLIIGAMMGIWIANDRRLTILEQQMQNTITNFSELKQVTIKLTDNQADVVRALDRVTILMDQNLGMRPRGGR